MRPGNFSYDPSLLAPDMSEWKLLHRHKFISEKTKVFTPRTDFLGFYFNGANRHQYKIDGLAEGTIHRARYNMLYIPAGSCELTLPKGNHSAFHFQITPAYLQQIISGYKREDELLSTLMESVRKKRPASISNSNLTITRRMRTIIYEDRENTRELKGIVRQMHRYAKLMDLLACCLTQIHDFSKAKLHKTEIVKIRKAHTSLAENLSVDYSVASLAKLVEMDTERFEVGFQILYGEQPLQCHLNERMSRAEDLLLATRKSEKRISEIVGYTNQAEFTEVFVKYFNRLPGDLRRNHITPK